MILALLGRLRRRPIARRMPLPIAWMCNRSLVWRWEDRYGERV